jgi:hypothetical protein
MFKRVYMVAYFDEALCHKAEDLGFETPYIHWILSIYIIPPVALGPGIHPASMRNE